MPPLADAWQNGYRAGQERGIQDAEDCQQDVFGTNRGNDRYRAGYAAGLRAGYADGYRQNHCDEDEGGGGDGGWGGGG
jgi:hypothetical protein